MTIAFENDNDVIVYVLEKIIDYARKNQYIFVAQSVWWIASIIGLDKGLVIHIDNLRIRSEVYQAPAAACNNTFSIHPDWLLQLESVVSNWENPPSRSTSAIGSEKSAISNDRLHNQLLQNCEQLLQESAFERKKIAKTNLKASKKLLKTKPNKNHETLTEGIEICELRWRKTGGECQRSAWPSGHNGNHKMIDCIQWKRLAKETVPIPKKR